MRRHCCFHRHFPDAKPLEFYPVKKYNLKFFGAYVGRFFRYSDYAKTNFDAINSNTGRVMPGLIAPLLIL